MAEYDKNDKRIKRCEDCKHKVVTVEKNILRNGAIQFRAICNKCGHKSGAIPHAVDPSKAKDFYQTSQWLRLRYRFLQNPKNWTCILCGARREDGEEIQPDHIKPRYQYPHLALEMSNLQPLCKSCNLGKYQNRDETNWIQFQKQQLTRISEIKLANLDCTTKEITERPLSDYATFAEYECNFLIGAAQ